VRPLTAPAVTAPAEDGALSPAQQEQLQAERLLLLREGVRQVRGPRFLVDLAVAWAAYQAGAGWGAWLYLGLMTLGLWGRSLLLERWVAAGREPAGIVRQMNLILAGLGLLHAGLFVLVFLQPHSHWHYLLTMVLVGNAAGAVATVAGDVRAYLLWVAIYGGSLGLGWLARGTLEGLIVVGLLLLMFAVLVRHVYGEGRAQVRLVRLADALRSARDRAERASESKTRFFAAASHDLRQPLTALSYHVATVQALASQQKDERLAQVGAGLRRALQDSQALLNSLMEVSQLDAGAVAVQAEDVDLLELLRRCADDYAPQASQQGLAFDCVLPELPEGETLRVHTDPALLRRILSNLFSNALKFTAQGRICLMLHREGERAALSVQDSGPGIAPELKERVFEEFFQINNSGRNRAQGLGLGLAIVRRLVHLLGLELKLESQPGQGSCFTLWLPLGSASPARAPVVAASSTTPGGPAHRLLVVDDEVAIRDALAELLMTLGWSVRTASGVTEALSCLSPQWQPEALVLDYRLRDEVTGLDALAALRAEGCQAPAWVITGETTPDRVQTLLAAGLPVRHKPVDGLALAHEISASLRSATAGR